MTKSDLNTKILRLHPYHPYHPYHLDKNVTSSPSPVTSLSPLLTFFVSLGTLEPVGPDGLTAAAKTLRTSKKKRFLLKISIQAIKRLLNGYCRLIPLSSLGYIHMAVCQNPGTPGEHQNSW